MKNRWLFILVFSVFVVAIIPLLRYEWYLHSANKVAVNYLQHLTRGEYAKAFNYVGYFDKSVETKPSLTYQTAKKIWDNRIKKMTIQDDIHIISYSNLNIRDDNGGFPVANAELIISEHGKKEKIYTNLFFVKRNGKWKITNIAAREDDKSFDYKWENIISGKINVDTL